MEKQKLYMSADVNNETMIKTCNEAKADKILFLCDGEVPTCRKKNCYKKVNDSVACHHTFDVTHALHFKLNRTGRIYKEEPQLGTAAQTTTE